MKNRVCIYLRKSRADEEVERVLGEGETLRKHRTALLKYARDKDINVVEIKEEIVSGDSLTFRPKMLELLQEIEQNKYTGVLCMDIDRLGRGGMKDQGTILETFKEHNTLIITPSKTYNLNDDIDEEMTEFKAFFARRELKLITKRMQGGRLRSVQDGNYIATSAPLGYDITYIQKSRTLKINKAEAEIIKIIFSMYSNSTGATAIADFLNSAGFKTKLGNDFIQSSVLTILKNPVYIGKVTWKKREEKKSKVPGKGKDCRTRDKSEWIVVQGKHEPIVSEELFNKCQETLNNRYHIPYQLKNKPINPLSGLITCQVCGKKMTMRPSRGINRLLCTYRCGNASCRFDLVERELINQLELYLKNQKFLISNKYTNESVDISENKKKAYERELSTLKKQKTKLFDFLERGIYDEETFLERSKNLDERIESTKIKLNDIIKSSTISKKDLEKNLVIFQSAIEAYKSTTSVELKNKLLKELLFKIDFYKEKGSQLDDFKLTIYPKLLR